MSINAFGENIGQEIKTPQSDFEVKMQILAEIESLKNRYSLDEYSPRNRVASEGDMISNALSNPLSANGLSTFLADLKKVIILVNDGSRATPTSLVLKEILPDLEAKECKFIVATGTHRNPTDTEISRIFGQFADQLRESIIFHDCHKELDFYGRTSFGNDIYFSKYLAWADAVIVIGSVEPHYFAGYSGGRKSLLPGIAGYDTIERNHKHALSNESEILKLKGNPIHEDMMEALDLIDKPIFSIQMVLDLQNKVYSCVAGNIKKGLEVSTKHVDALYKIVAKKKYDIVIAIVDPPLDKNLYQAHKGVENCKNILKKGGTFILVAQCNEGIGNDNFYNLLAQCESPSDVFARIEAGYVLVYHKAAKLSQLMIENQLILVSNLEEKVVSDIFIQPFRSLRSALEMTLNKKKINPDIAVIYNAGISVVTNKN